MTRYDLLGFTVGLLALTAGLNLELWLPEVVRATVWAWQQLASIRGPGLLVSVLTVLVVVGAVKHGGENEGVEDTQKTGPANADVVKGDRV